MELVLRLGTSCSWQEVQVHVDGEAWGTDLAEALVSAGLVPVERRDRLRLGRTGRLISVAVPLGELGLRFGDLLLLDADSGAVTGESTRPGVALVVASGPQAGERAPVTGEGLVVGRADGAGLLLDDAGLSRAHFRVEVSDEGVTVVDLGSRNGTFHAGKRVEGSRQPVVEDLPIEAGNSVFRVVRDPEMPDEPRIRHRDGFGEFNRAPRVIERSGRREFAVPAPPGEKPPRRIPLIASLAPLLMAPAFVLMGGGLGFLGIALLSPLMLLASWWEDRIHGGRDHADETERFRLAVATTADALRRHVEWECGARWRRSPDPAELLARTAPTTRLWERRTGDADFLRLRVGWSDLPSESTVDIEDGGLRSLRESAEQQLEPLLVAHAVPVELDLPEIGSLGVVGGGADVEDMQRWLMFQLATLHSPREVVLGAVVPTRDSWGWLARLPHAAWDDGRTVAAGEIEGRDLMGRLRGIVEEREEARRSSTGSRARSDPTVVVLVDDRVELPRSTVTTVLEDGPGVGVHLIWSSDARAAVPGQCGAVATISGSAVSTVLTGTGAVVDDASADRVPIALVEAASWQIAGLRDAAARDRAAEVPARVSLAESLEMPVPSPEVIAARWSTTTGLGAPLGMDAQGPHWLDLREDGPHALLGGTTGAGKSELLQSLVGSLAATHPPDRLTFLLVDYKGGAAFKDCVRLPHTVGYVTDLDGHLVSRVLVSLHAELSFRERLLATVGAKDLIDMEQRSPGTAPPSLLLVVDEFAALASELPEFVDGVVNLAQRGRSLGMHLLLATQRPAGAINDNIRANTNLRISLRMNDRADSEDVIGSPVAAALPRTLPGRSYVRTGATQLAEVQVAYGGGRSFGARSGRAEVTVRAPGQQPTTAVRRSDVLATEAETDLQLLVGTIELTFAASEASSPRVPWLPPLEEWLPVGGLPLGEGTVVPIGRRDEPHRQAQEVHEIDVVSDGGLLVAGSAGSGKTTALRTLAARLAEQNRPDELHLYALDFGSRGLSPLSSLPHCGDVVHAEETARVTRLFVMLEAAIKERRSLLARAGVTSYDELRAAQKSEGRPPTPRLVVLLDGYGSFAQAFERVEYGALVDRFPVAIAEGRAVGIHWVVTAERRLSVPASVLAALPQRLILRFHDTDEYDSFGLDRARTKDVELPPGRGFSQTTDEVQVAAYGEEGSTAAQAAALIALGSRLAARYDGLGRPGRVRLLPEIISWRELTPGARDGLSSLPLGLRDLDFATVGIDLTTGGFLVVGSRRSGKSTALRALVEGLLRNLDDVDLVLIAPRPTPLGSLPGWRKVHRDIRAAEDALDDLVMEIEGRTPADPWLVVVVDDVDELADGVLDERLAELAARGVEHRVRVLAAGDRAAAHRAYGGIVRKLRAERSGLVLQPDPDMDGDLFDAQLDRRHRGGPPGRGVLIREGRSSLLQVVAPEELS